MATALLDAPAAVAGYSNRWPKRSQPGSSRKLLSVKPALILHGAPKVHGIYSRNAGRTRVAALPEPDEQMGLRFARSDRAWLDHSDLELCMLPFSSDEIFLPGMEKTLHLYEARYISLLESAARRRDNMFVHSVVVESWGKLSSGERDAAVPGAFCGQDFALCCNCLVQIRNVERQDFGALVTIRGEGRADIQHLISTHPYIGGVVQVLKDRVAKQPAVVAEKAEHLAGVMEDVIDLAERLHSDASKDTIRMHSALDWCECTSEVQLGESEEPVLEKACRLSFAALQDIPDASEMDELMLIRARLDAMSTLDTEERLDVAIQVMHEARNKLAAKMALKDLNL